MIDKLALLLERMNRADHAAFVDAAHQFGRATPGTYKPGSIVAQVYTMAYDYYTSFTADDEAPIMGQN